MCLMLVIVVSDFLIGWMMVCFIFLGVELVYGICMNRNGVEMFGSVFNGSWNEVIRLIIISDMKYMMVVIGWWMENLVMFMLVFLCLLCCFCCYVGFYWYVCGCVYGSRCCCDDLLGCILLGLLVVLVVLILVGY